MKISRVPVLVAVAALAALGLSSPLAAAGDVLKLGIPLPLTGTEAKFGEMEKQAYELAAAEINIKAGAKGRKLEFEFLDSGGKPETSSALVEKLIAAGQPIIVGEYTSQCSYAVATIAERARVPYLVVTGAADKITQQGWKYVYRLNPPSALYNLGISSFFDDVAKPKSVAILYENTDFGTSTSKAMKEACEAKGITVVLNLPITERFQATVSDFKPVLEKVKAASPDIVYMVSYLADATTLMKQAKELDINPKAFIGGAAGFTMPEFVQNARDASELVMSGTLWSPQAKYPGAKAFFEKFKTKFGKEPDYHGAEAYAATYVLADTLARAKSLAPDDLRDALAATDLMTAFGPVKFVSWAQFTNQNRIPTLLLQVINRKFETIWPKAAATASYVYPVPRWKDRK